MSTKIISPADIKTKIIFDTYRGLLEIGYKDIGAIRALTILGIDLATAKAIANLYEEWEVIHNTAHDRDV